MFKTSKLAYETVALFVIWIVLVLGGLSFIAELNTGNVIALICGVIGGALYSRYNNTKTQPCADTELPEKTA